MRIGIIGTRGVGETTLAEELSTILNLSLITECARRFAQQVGIRDCSVLGANPLAVKFQTEILREQIKAERKHKSGFVSDRTSLDCLAYWHFYGLSELSASSEYEECCLGNLQNYDF